MDSNNQRFILGQRVIKFQLALGALCTCVVALISKDLNSAASALTGAILVILPTLLYAFIAFKRGVIAYPAVALGRHQQAMLVRFVANFALFAVVVIYYRQCNFLILFISYFITLSGYWFSLVKNK